MKLLIVFTIICLLIETINCRFVENDVNENRCNKRRRRFSVEELLTVRFPHAITGDVDIDICKAGKSIIK